MVHWLEIINGIISVASHLELLTTSLGLTVINLALIFIVSKPFFVVMVIGAVLAGDARYPGLPLVDKEPRHIGPAAMTNDMSV